MVREKATSGEPVKWEKVWEKQRAQPVGIESWVLLAISRAITQIKVRLLMIIYPASLSLGSSHKNKTNVATKLWRHLLILIISLFSAI